MHQFLLACSDLETELSQFYSQVAANLADSKDEARSWSRLADQEAANAQVIRTVASLQWLLDREGPFLAELPARLEAFQVRLEEAFVTVTPGTPGDRWRNSLEALDAGELHSVSMEALKLCSPLAERLGRLLDSPQAAFGTTNP